MCSVPKHMRTLGCTDAIILRHLLIAGGLAPFIFEYMVALGGYSIKMQQLAIVIGFAMEALGSCAGMLCLLWVSRLLGAHTNTLDASSCLVYQAGWSPSLWMLIASSSIASAGATVSWVFSSSILQVWTSERFRGRVFGLDIGLCTFGMLPPMPPSYCVAPDIALCGVGESISIIIAGVVLDFHLTPREAALFVAGIPALVYGLWWSFYFIFMSPRLDKYFLDRPEKYSFIPKDEEESKSDDNEASAIVSHEAKDDDDIEKPFAIQEYEQTINNEVVDLLMGDDDTK
jgi:hypothetical protein